MKDTLKTQGVTLPVVGIKKLIDYYNENYTKKKEYICKDLKPARMLDEDEYYKILRDTGLMTPLEVRYYPLFKISKIKNNRPRTITYIFKIDNEEYEGVMRRVQENAYSDGYTKISINGDEIFLASNDVFIDTEACSLTLYIDSPELPKLEYPKNKIDMYRAYNFIATVCYSINDENLYRLLDIAISNIPLPNNIDEIDLFLEDYRFCNILDIRKNAYFVNPDKDNYYTILDVIKKGKTIYRSLDTPLVNWSINNEEKWIKFNRNIAIVNETSWVDLEK